MRDVLCMYYSRTGNTKRAVEEIARELDAECVELNDAVERNGWKGWLRCALDAVRKSTAPLSAFQTERRLSEYQLVILGTPVWAGRCSAVMRAFLKAHGEDLRAAAYVITRGGGGKSEEVFRQMDQYIPAGHRAAVSLRSGDAGFDFWQKEFLRQIREML